MANPATNKVGAYLSEGVWEPSGFFHSLPLRSFDSAGQDLEITVPADMPLHVTMGGDGLSVKDATGAVVQNQGADMLLTIPAGTGPMLVTFEVDPISVVTTTSGQRRKKLSATPPEKRH